MIFYLTCRETVKIIVTYLIFYIFLDSEMAMHFLDKFNLMVIKIQSKFDLRRICGALGATATLRLGPLTPEEIGECSL